MKCTIPEISWHNRDPVLSLDIQPINFKEESYRLASGGTDTHVLIWYMSINKTGSVNLDLAADLTRHQRAVNVVKWSPNGDYLASGDDDSVIFIWKLKSRNENLNIFDVVNEQDKETWISIKILRGHMEDIYDLCWSPDSQFLVSGSVDNTAIIWDVSKGKSVCILRDHKGFVQGVAWDPLNQYIATLSTDRYLRIFDIQTKKVVNRTSKCTLPVPEGDELYGKVLRIYEDDTLQTFFRRLCFSPDGKLLITPAGVTDYDGCIKSIHATYIYSRYSLKQPAIILPSDQYTIAVKCCPVLFKLRPHTETNKPVVPLPYRIVFAVATKSSVYLYDTQQKMPFGLISNIHYTRLTDLTWSKDARLLVVSSTDGFCSVIVFSENELGESYEADASSTEIEKENLNSEQNIEFKAKENKSKEKSKETENKTDDKVSTIENSLKQSEKANFSDGISNQTSQARVAVNTKSEVKLVLDKDIISSEGKFEIMNKEQRPPPTQIAIRRYPRNALPQSPFSSVNKTQKNNTENEKESIKSSESAKESIKSSESAKESPKSQKTKNSKKSSIKQPRTLITNPVEDAIVEEAIHSWPSDVAKTMSIHDDDVKCEKECEPGNKLTVVSENNKPSDVGTIDNTEDIRLVYEETQDEEEGGKSEKHE